MRTIDKIVESKIVEKACHTLAGHLADDLQQHLYLMFCKMSERKLAELWERNFDFYVYRCVLNAMQAGSNFMRWHQSPREGYEDIEPTYEVENQIDAALKIEKINAKLDSMYWYHRDLFKLYIKLGTLRAVEKQTGIPAVSVWETVNKVRKSLKNEINENTDSNKGRRA